MRMKPGRRDLILQVCSTTRIKHEPAQDRFTRRQLEQLALWCSKAVQFNRHIDRTVRDGEEGTGDKPTPAGVPSARG